MRTSTAARIVSECLDYTNKYGSFPKGSNRSERRNIKRAFKITYYNPGDFSFIKNDFKRVALEHDYKVITRLDAWDILRTHYPVPNSIYEADPKTIWDAVYFYMYYYHTNETLNLSIKELQYISINSWNEYVLKELKKQ